MIQPSTYTKAIPTPMIWEYTSLYYTQRCEYTSIIVAWNFFMNFFLWIEFSIKASKVVDSISSNGNATLPWLQHVPNFEFWIILLSFAIWTKNIYVFLIIMSIKFIMQCLNTWLVSHLILEHLLFVLFTFFITYQAS